MIERTAPAATAVAKLGVSQVASGPNPIEAICNCLQFPSGFQIKAVTRKAKRRQFDRFQSFIQNFPSFGRGFDSALLGYQVWESRIELWSPT
jgi:hypothetical protein